MALALGVSVVVAPVARAADEPWAIDGTVADADATLLEPPVEPFGNVKDACGQHPQAAHEETVNGD